MRMGWDGMGLEKCKYRGKKKPFADPANLPISLSPTNPKSPKKKEKS